MTTRLLTVVLLSGLLSGCSRWSFDMGERLDQDLVPQRGNGVTLADVLREFGPPLRISATPSGYVLAWEYWHVEEESLGFSLGFAGADLFSFDYGNATTRGDFMVLGFDHQHRLIDSAFKSWESDAGGGQGIQPLFGVVPVVDVDDLTRRLPTHRWGAGSLEDLPVTLNHQNRLDQGQSGIQQRGTSTGVGQRSLEMD
jgi:hypothetical protein